MPTKPTEGSFVAIMRQGEDGRPQILLAVREDGQGLNLVGGRLEEGETPEACAVREALEETGLIVQLHGQIGRGLLMLNDESEVTDIARLFRASIGGGTLRNSDESDGFRWVFRSALIHPEFPIAKRPCPGYERGRTYEMATRALLDKSLFFSQVLDPDNLACTIRRGSRAELSLTPGIEGGLTRVDCWE